MFNVGDKLFFRTVTFHLVGEVERVDGKWLKLKDAAWVADSGRFTQALKDGSLHEVEPVGTAFLNTDTVIDAFPWVHDLPLAQR